VIPIVTPEEMRAIDAEAPEPVGVLIERAGAATTAAARRLLGGSYGRRVLVVAGKGNNGNDGRAAARRLAARGVRVHTIAPGEQPPAGPPADLVIDAAFGTGFRGGWAPPDVGPCPVLAVDIPSGVDGATGEAGAPGHVLAAVATVTFAALKPGLVLLPGRALAGVVEVADIGLDCRRARAWQVTPADVAAWLPPRPVDTHKWKAACWAVAGSPAMPGASHLCVRAALRAGAGYVRLSSPGLDRSPGAPTEAVYHPIDATGWAADVVAGAERFGSVVIGPGLGRSPDGDVEIRRAVAGVAAPLVVDGDGLSALGERAADILRARRTPAVLTPHDGEFARLAGHRPGADRFDDVRRLAAACRAVVLLKGPTTVVADANGRVGVSLAGDSRLATAGSGDVLSGIIAALLAEGVDPWRAALAGAEVHGLAARHGPRRGLVAGDLPAALPAVWQALR
jgi:NAD(P)H-hydrate epimerase